MDNSTAFHKERKKENYEKDSSLFMNILTYNIFSN